VSANRAHLAAMSAFGIEITGNEVSVLNYQAITV
jgi:hypothetical protein